MSAPGHAGRSTRHIRPGIPGFPHPESPRSRCRPFPKADGHVKSAAPRPNNPEASARPPQSRPGQDWWLVRPQTGAAHPANMPRQWRDGCVRRRSCRRCPPETGCGAAFHPVRPPHPPTAGSSRSGSAGQCSLRRREGRRAGCRAGWTCPRRSPPPGRPGRRHAVRAGQPERVCVYQMFSSDSVPVKDT